MPALGWGVRVREITAGAAPRGELTPNQEVGKALGRGGVARGQGPHPLGVPLLLRVIKQAWTHHRVGRGGSQLRGAHVAGAQQIKGKRNRRATWVSLGGGPAGCAVRHSKLQVTGDMRKSSGTAGPAAEPSDTARLCSWGRELCTEHGQLSACGA